MRNDGPRAALKHLFGTAIFANLTSIEQQFAEPRRKGFWAAQGHLPRTVPPARLSRQRRYFACVATPSAHAAQKRHFYLGHKGLILCAPYPRFWMPTKSYFWELATFHSVCAKCRIKPNRLVRRVNIHSYCKMRTLWGNRRDLIQLRSK